MTPGDSLFHPGKTCVLLAGSIEQARLVWSFVRPAIEPNPDYRILDSSQRLGVWHKPTGTNLRVISSNAKTAMGLVNVPLVVADECGSWETIGGQLMHEALSGAQGKPGSPLRVLYVSTLAPSTAGWWAEMVNTGSTGSTYVQAIVGNRGRWSDWSEIRRCNPLMARFPASRRKLLEERDKARGDSRLRAAFCSYRLNIPTADESTVLLSVDDWQRVVARPLAPAEGQPVVGVDLGGGRAWSAAVAVWRSGRIEALAVAPGIPDIESQERRDRVPAGTYRRLVQAGVLRVADGLRVQPPAQLAEMLRPWRPEVVICDRFRLPELLDHVGSIPVSPRITVWSTGAADVRALRSYALDGPLSVAPSSRALLQASLSVAATQSDSSGNVKLTKLGSSTTLREMTWPRPWCWPRAG